MRALIILIIALNILYTGSVAGQSEPNQAGEIQEISSKRERDVAPDAKSVAEHIRDLLKNDQYEKAYHYILEVMPSFEDKSYLYFKLSQTELGRRRHKESFEAFEKALDLLNPPDSPPAVDPEVERQLNVVSLIRVHKAYEIALLILQDMLDKNSQSASILYEMSYLRANQEEFSDFLVYYYHAYKRDPANPRALPGRTMIGSVTTPGSIPKPEDFTWLKIAQYYFDNKRAWTNVMLELKKHDMLEDTKVAALITEEVPDDIKWIFYYYYYDIMEKEQAKQEAIRSVKSRAGKDWRFERVRRGLLFHAGLESEAIDQAGPEPNDPYQRVFYHDFWMSYYHLGQSQLDVKGLNAFRGLINAVLEYIKPIVPSKEKQTQITNRLVTQIARLRINKDDYRSAIEIFKTREGELTWEHCEVVASLCLKLEKNVEAVEWLVKGLMLSPDSERQDAARRVLKYSLLCDHYDAAAEWLKYAEQQNLSSVVADYKDLVAGKHAGRLSHHRIANVPGHYSISTEPPWRSVRLGVCARACVYSLVNVYGKNLTYDQVSKELDGYLEDQVLPLNSLEKYFKETGFEVVYFAPTKEVAKEFVAGDKPLLLMQTIATSGIIIGHVSVVKAFDDRSGEFFLEDVSGVTKETVSYDRIIDSLGLALVVPSDSTDKLVPESLKKYVVCRPWEKLSEKEFDRLINSGPELKYWALCHNGRQYLGSDSQKSVKYFEEAIVISEKIDSIFYYDLIKACLIVKDIDKALKYLKEAMKAEPENLPVMKLYVEVTRDRAIKNNELNAEVARGLFDVTVEMERINPDFPTTYLLRGDLFFRGSMLQNALNSFQIYLEKYPGMDEAWQQRNKRFRESAAKAIEICRNAMAEQGK